MPLFISSVINSVTGAFKSLCDFLKTSKEHQSETAVLKENARFKKALNAAEDIIILIYKYLPLLEEDDAEDFKKLVEKFQKNN